MAKKIGPWTGKCPTCGAKEVHPDGGKIVIRGLKVFDELGLAWSQCLRCSGFYDVMLREQPEQHVDGKGWFATS